MRNMEIIDKTGDSIVIDLGLTNFLVDSCGRKVVNPRHLKKSKDMLEMMQLLLPRLRKGFRNRTKARLLVAKTHEKIANLDDNPRRLCHGAVHKG